MQLNIKEELLKCCGSKNWAEQMISYGKFESAEKLIKTSDEIWFSLNRSDWLEAFSHHPKIGDINSLKEKYSTTKHLAEKEQSGVDSASMETLKELSEFNERYEKKFGYIFIVCATGKTALEMLEIIKDRILNDPNEELTIAVQEQNKITKLRLTNIIKILL